MTLSDHKIEMSKVAPALQCIEYHEVVVQVFKNNLVMIRFRNNCAIGAQHLKNAMDAAKKLANKPRCKVILYVEPGVVYTAEGRAYSHSKDHMQNKIAWAAISSSSLRIFFVNMIQKIRNDGVPYRMFKGVDEAMHWLETA
jgi:methionine synthase I (cobalamin-dependent)